MSTSERGRPGPAQGGDAGAPTGHADELEQYGGGYIQSRHGYIPAWLLAVYLILFVWALYYLYAYWGGLGPGLGL